MIDGEFSDEFIKLMYNAVKLSFYKYGSAKKNFGEGRVDAIKTAEACLEAFKKDHNTEHLVDVANYCMFAFMYPEAYGAHYEATDSDKSVKPVGTPVNMEMSTYFERWDK